MKKISIVLCALISSVAYSQSNQPKLVVGIVVDQMRHEYLQRFESKFSNDGFKRMMRDGFEAKNTHYNYVPTYTAPGHASIYTGTTPRYHGIIANDWYSKVLERPVYCVGDTTVQAVAGSASSGKISPRNLQVNTITDELKLTTNFRSKVIGLSIKDRGAVLPAGHTPNAAYWYDSRTGEFMTSDFYLKSLPDWVKAFNDKKLVDKYCNQTWNTILPIKEYIESTEDNVPYEKGFKGKDTPTFPYNLEELRVKNEPYGLIRTTPFGNSILLDLAKAAITSEKLGEDQITDFLAVSFSSTDYVGHNFGPNSIELEDTYIRLDRDLADLFKFLDKTVGVGQYTVFLTADHGVAANPLFLTDHELPGGYIGYKASKDQIHAALQAANLPAEKVIKDISNDQIFLNHEWIKSQGLDLISTQKAVAEAFMLVPEISEVFLASAINNQDFTDPMRICVQNGFNRKLSGDLVIIHKPGYLYDNYGVTGTTHGTGFTYDTHVPLLFFGAGIKKGSTVDKTYITDIAPTLAIIMNISMPNAAITGKPIQKMFE